MRVAMVNFTSGALSGGYAKYLKQIVPLIEADPRVQRLDVFLPESALASAQFAATNVHTWSAASRRKHFQSIAEHNPDVVFVPTARWADFGSVPVTAMVRNMEPLVTPVRGNSLRDAARNLVRRYVARTTCERAQRVIAVSEYVREYLEQEWRVSANKIGMVYHGVETAIPESAARQPSALRNLSKDTPVIFTAGSIRPARGLEDIIGACVDLTDWGEAFHLVIAGSVTPGAVHYEQKMMERANALLPDSSITWTGRLTADEMSWCFHRSNAFVLATRAEACPNTALEAMAHGALIVSADTKPLPEFFGDAALYYSSGNAASLARQLQKALRLPRAERGGLTAAARARAGTFQWSETARLTVDELIYCATGRRADP
jgi:glycosyltransferase involved in cell wall biosynthesis